MKLFLKQIKCFILHLRAFFFKKNVGRYRAHDLDFDRTGLMSDHYTIKLFISSSFNDTHLSRQIWQSAMLHLSCKK